MAQPTFTLRTADGELDQATVVSFSGSEAISGLYQFDITVKVPQQVAVDLDAVLRADATFTLAHDGANHRRHGILRAFEMRHTAGGYSYYAARLVPRAWRLSTYPTNEVFTGPDFRQVDGIIAAVLANGGFSSGNDFDISGLTAAYAERDYTCQFGETDFAFIARLMERDGIWFHFEQGEDAERLVLHDDANYAPLDMPAIVYAVAPDDGNRYRSIHAWVCRKQRLPHDIVLRDYNYEQPSLDVSGSATVDADGIGSAFIYGENFTTAEEGRRLAQVRAEELSCRKTLFHGQGAVPAFEAGRTFELTGHPAQNGAWNDRRYLLIAVTHEGENLDNPLGAAKSPRYANTFTAMPADVQFRAERVTPKPRFDGTMTAVVYAENAAAALAEVDEAGRYRVRLPFDRAGADGEKASHWIRMAQPYAGVDQGTYFPLKANTEVLLTFINGDPDRPVIAGAVPNGANLALLTAQTANQATIATPDLLRLQAGGGTHTNVATARYMQDKGGGGGIPPMAPPFNELNPGTGERVGEMSSAAEVAGEYHVERVYGDSYRFADGGRFSWGSENTFSFGNDYEELHEGLNYVGDAGGGAAATRYTFTQHTGDYVDDPEKEIFEIPVLGRDREKSEGLIEKNWGNKLEYHFGASYNWAGGHGPGGSRPEYNFGNSYAENLHEKVRGTFASEYGSTRHDAWTSEARIDATKSAIEKTYGATYEYHHGFAYEVHEGDTRAETWGNTTETVHGDITGTVHGDTDDTIHGDTTEMVYGDAKSTVHGSTNDMVLGGVNDMHLGGKNEMTVAAINNMALSIENNMWLGAKTDIAVGAVFEMTAGPKIELKLSPAIEADSVAELRTKVTQIDTILTSLENAVTVIKAAPTTIKNGALSLNLSALKFW